MSRLVIGVGNPGRGDDGAGVAAVRLLRHRVPPGVQAVECQADLTRLLDLWSDEARVFLIDAACSGGRAGAVRRLDGLVEPLGPHGLRLSTHAIGVEGAVELARALGRLPRQLTVYAIEGREFSHFTGLSPEVQRAVEGVVEQVLGDLGVTGS